MKTYVPTQGAVPKQWYVIDAEGQSIGRVAAVAASLLRGKHKPEYTPFLDCGDSVVIINAAKVRVIGSKGRKKVYYRHSGYPGGLKETPLEIMLEKNPGRAMEIAINGMLPKNRLGRKLATQYRVYSGADHPHEAQNPISYTIK